MDEERVQQTDNRETSPHEAPSTYDGTTRQQEQTASKKELLPSEITIAELEKAVKRLDAAEASRLVSKLSAQRREEKEAERLAQERAEENEATSEDSADQEEEEEFEPRKPEIRVYRTTIESNGHPAKTAGLTLVKDFMRGEDCILSVSCTSEQDGTIDQVFNTYTLSHELHFLYESLTLPTHVEDFGTTRKLFDGVCALLRKHVNLAGKECSLLAFWAISTWFTDYLPFIPSVLISGPPSTADLLLRTLVTVCRRPLLLGELSPSILRKLPINEISPTLLVREPQLNRYLSALLNASNQPGYLFFSGNQFQQLYCPKCIYVGEFFKQSRATSNAVHIDLGDRASMPRHALPTDEEITSFQNQLYLYRVLNHDKVAAANFHVSGFAPEVGVVADALAAAIVDDAELQRRIMEVLQDRDEQARVDRATGVNGLVLRAVLLHCHQKDDRKFVREIAATANRFYAEDGESVKLSSESVGHALKSLGLYSRRLGNAGRGLIFDKATQAQAHRLSRLYDVLTPEPGCENCHEVQQPQTEELVQHV